MSNKPGCGKLCGALRVVMEHEQLVQFERQFGVGLALIVGELDLVCPRKNLNHGAYLATDEPVLRDVTENSDHI